MENRKLNKFKSAFALLLLLSTATSIFFAAHEKFHECSGEDCQICLLLQAAELNAKLLLFVLGAKALKSAATNSQAKVFFASRLCKKTASTPVSQKIRMNN